MVASLPDWEAGPSGPSGPVVVTNQCQINVGTAVPVAWMQPFDLPPSGNQRSWPLDCVYRKFFRAEFDVLPVFGSGSSGNGQLSLFLGATPTSGAPSERTAQLWVEYRIDAAYLGATATLDVRVPNYSLCQTLFERSVLQRAPALLPGFTTGPLRLALELGWDYFQTPTDFANPPNCQPPSHQGQGWLYSRLSFWNGSGWTVVDPKDVTNPWWADPNRIESTGTHNWIQHGENGSIPYVQGGWSPYFPDFYDWQVADPLNPLRIYATFQATDRSHDVSWRLDNFKLCSFDPPPFTVFVNTVGYDPASVSQHAFLAGNQSTWRWNKYSLASATGEVWSTCCGKLSDLDAIALIGVEFLKEAEDWEDWNGNAGGYVQQPVCWWGLTWPPITTSHTDCWVTVTATTAGPNPQTLTVTSPTFDLQEDLHLAPLLQTLSIANEQERRAPDVNPGQLDGGWYDASNENGENRAHGSFMSGMARTLRRRARLMTTAEVENHIKALEFGARFLFLEVAENNDLSRSYAHNAACNHYLDATGLALAGHIYHEHQSRPNAKDFNQPDWRDGKNSDTDLYEAGLGLIDAAAALKNFDLPFADTCYVQARDTRDYLYNLDEACGWPSQDGIYGYRTQAILDLAFHEYLLNNPLYPGYTGDELDQKAHPKLCADLINPALEPLNNPWEWVQSGGGAGQAQYPASEGLFWMVENNVHCTCSMMHACFEDAVVNLMNSWYLRQVDGAADNQGTPHPNPLWMLQWYRTPRPPSLDQYLADDRFPAPKIVSELYAAAEGAVLLRSLSPVGYAAEVGQLERLAVGTMNWLQGLHFGIRGRYGIPGSDLEYAPMSLINAQGSVWAAQTQISLHRWQSPTLANGLTGQPGAPLKVTPWSYLPSDYIPSESFIKNDGGLLIALDALSRLLHPFVVLEAEDYTSAYTGDDPVSVESNNVVGPPHYRNGGQSVVDIEVNDWLRWVFIPPDPRAVTFGHWLWLRVANDSGSPQQVRVQVDPASGAFTQDVSVQPTAHRHDYRIVPVGPVPLAGATSHVLKVTFLGPACSLDSVAVQSRGVNP